MPAENELQLYIDNDGTLYRNLTKPLRQRLATRKLAGTYDRAKALKGFEAIANEGARAYRKEFGSSFSVSERKDCARGMLDYFEVEYSLGNIKPDASKSSKGSGKTRAQLDAEIDQVLSRKR